MIGTNSPLPPGTWIGVMGGGQLGRMLTVEARRMGYRVCILDPDPNSPAAQVSDDHITAPYASVEAAQELARRVSVITYEFENIDAASVVAAEALCPVLPGSRILKIAQHRIREKETLARLGFPVPAFYPVYTRDDLLTGLNRVGLPAVLKTATSGYDGKGQRVIHFRNEAQDAFDSLRPKSPALIVEEFVPFRKELSAICARDTEGNTACYPASENIHQNGILDVTIAPARVSAQVVTAAQEMALAIATRLELVGLLAVEMFLTQDDRLLVNELAPRPHNSGHHTLDACATSQFEQLVRVLCNLPQGIAELTTPAVMVNLMGELWEQSGGQPDFAGALAIPRVKLHLYGKAEPRRGRKMGHLCAVAPDVEVALQRALLARGQTMPTRINVSV